MATATAIDQALATVDDVAAEGDLTAEARALLTLDATTHEAIVLPDGRTIYPPSLFGEPLHEVACRLLDAQDPTRSRYLKLIGPARDRQEPDRQGDRLHQLAPAEEEGDQTARQPVLRADRAAARPVRG